MTTTQSLRRARRVARRASHRMIAGLPDPLRSTIEDALSRRRVRAAYDEPLVPEAELRASFEAAIETLNRLDDGPLGDYLEFGVCHGTSMRCMHQVLRGHPDRDRVAKVRMFGFDSFEGLPPEAADDDDGHWQPGQFDSDEEYTRQLLAEAGVDWSRTELIKGWFSDTLTDELLERKAMAGNTSIAMVDCDMYLSAKDALRFCVTALADTAIVFFDDWNSGGGLADRNLGEKRAFDEFLAEHPQFTAEEQPDLSYSPNAVAFVVRRSEAG